MTPPLDSPAAGRSHTPPRRDPVEGLLLVDKPGGMTSHDVVAGIRRRFKFLKVGHGGTLDPMATGLLIILLGRGGTRLSQWVMGSDKEYEGTMHLGIRTDTQDAEGRVLREAPATGVTREALEEQMRRWTGDVLQTPPMVSALKLNGVPLYKLARKGEEVERKPRLLHIYQFDLLEFDPPYARFLVSCTKGTYVRTLCDDVGEALGCGAHLRALRRTRSGSIRVEDALPYAKVMDMSQQELEAAVTRVEALDRHQL